MSLDQKQSRSLETAVKPLGAIACAILLGLTMLVSVSPAQDSNTIRLVGSRYMYFAVTDLATKFMQDRQNSKVVVTTSEPYTYLESLSQKTSDAVMTLGRLDDDLKAEAEERGIQLAEQVIGWGSVALITDPKNPVNHLTVDQVRKIFLGEYRNWNQVGGLDEPIVTMSRDESVSGTQKFFQETVLDGTPAVQETVRELNYDIIRAVWRRKGSIADARYTEAVRGKVKGMVKILAVKKDENAEAVMPSVETSRNQTYPLCFPMVLYYDPRLARPDMGQFVQFCAERGLGPHYAESASEK